MINLIPDHLRLNNRYAYKNVRLLRYLIISAMTMAAIIAITGLSILGMLQTQNSLHEEIDGQNQKLTAYKPLEKQGQLLADQISTINTLLNRQVTFSTLLPAIAKILPPGAILKQLDFSTSDILPTSVVAPTGSSSSSGAPTTVTAKPPQKPFVILASVSDRAVAATLLENIKANKDLFTDADLVDVTQTSTSNSNSSAVSDRYPYQVTINAYLKKLSAQAGGSR